MEPAPVDNLQQAVRALDARREPVATDVRRRDLFARP